MDGKVFSIILLVFAFHFSFLNNANAQKFIHPGIDQTSADLEYMKMPW